MTELEITRRHATGLFAAAVAAPAILTGTALSNSAAADYPPTDGHMQGFVLLKERKRAPDTPFFDGKENVRHFADFKGEVVLVNFWATWCAPCIKEMPALDRLRAHFADQDFRLLAVSQDRGGHQVAEPFVRNRLELPELELFYDPRLRLGRSLGVRGLPSTYLIDAKGDLVGGLIGPAEWDHQDAINLVQHVLDETAVQPADA